MSQRQAALQRLSMSTYDKLYHDAQVHEDRLQTKKQQLGCSSASDGTCLQTTRSSANGKLRSTLCSTFSLDSDSPRMAAGDRLYAYHLKKQVCTHRNMNAQARIFTQRTQYPEIVMVPACVIEWCQSSESRGRCSPSSAVHARHRCLTRMVSRSSAQTLGGRHPRGRTALMFRDGRACTLNGIRRRRSGNS